MKLPLILLSVLLVLLQYRLWFGDGGLVELSRLDAAVAAQRNENVRLRALNATLEAEVRDLKDGLEAVEERARRELGMIGRGETFFQFVED